MSAGVVVVGAGPAGCAAAITCLQAGLPVTVLDRQELGRERVGETLHPGVEAPLRALGVWDAVERAGFLRHEGIWHVARDGRRFVPYGADAQGPWRGLQAWRARFDALLAARVAALGGAIVPGCRALEPLMAGPRVAGVVTARGELPAALVVDASGAGHWLARRLELPIVPRTPRLLATHGYAFGRAAVAGDAPVLGAEGSSWTWIARVRPATYQWTRLDTEPSHAPIRAPPRALAHLEGTGPRATDVTWRAVARVAGPGYAIAGDAAFTVDPAASHGVLHALIGGLLAGRAGSAGLLARGDADRCRPDYERWARERFAHDVLALGALYRGLPRPPSWLVPSPSTHAVSKEPQVPPRAVRAR